MNGNLSCFPIVFEDHERFSLFTNTVYMASLIIRNLFYTFLQPGTVVGLIPYLIVRGRLEDVFNEKWSLLQNISLIAFVIGLIIMLWCIWDFANKGRGTISPADPTKQLITSGLYRYSRNPMYIGVIVMLVSEALFFNQLNLWIYMCLMIVAFNVFIRWHEEPRLEDNFGEEYITYMKKVRRWF